MGDGDRWRELAHGMEVLLPENRASEQRRKHLLTSLASGIGFLFPQDRAREAIKEKASELAPWIGGLPDDPWPYDLGGNRYYVLYEYATIFWSGKTGAHEVHGAILDKYYHLGGANGFLGLPITDELPAKSGVGRYNDFEHGSIYWHPDVGAHEVHGEIRNAWLVLGGTADVGFPITDESDAVGGKFSDFQILRPDSAPPGEDISAIYWKPGLAGCRLRGRTLARWREVGAERSFLGYPINDQSVFGDAPFERGIINSDGTITPDQRVIDSGQINLSGAAALGRAILLISSAGTWNYSGHVRTTGAISYDFSIATVLNFKDAAGIAKGFTAKGDVEGTLTWGGHRLQEWDEWGTDDWILANWDSLTTCSATTRLALDFNINKLMGIIGTILGVVAIVVGTVVGGALAITWLAKNTDTCGGYDANGNRVVTFVPKGSPCEPGQSKRMPRDP